MCRCTIAHLRRAVEGVGIEDGLDHDQTLRHIFLVQLVAVVRGLVRTVVEHLQERRPPQVEHELQGGGGREGGEFSKVRNSIFFLFLVVVRIRPVRSKRYQTSGQVSP